MKKLLLCITATFMVCGLYAGTITIPGDKNTDDKLTAAEWNTWKNRVGNVINGNIDTANIKTDGVGTSELVNDAVTPAKLDEDNTTVFTMKGLVVTDGVTASTMTTTSTGTFAVANITTIENSPTFTYGFTAATATIGNLTVSTLTVNTLYTPGVQVAIGEFTCPGGTGNFSVTGVGFEPRYVEFESFRPDNSRIKYGIGIMDYTGNQHVIAFASSGATGETRNATNLCILSSDESGTIDIRAFYVSIDSNGFTVNFSSANTNYLIYWKAVR